MDLLTLIKPQELLEFTENLEYKVSGYMGQALFPARKTNNLKLEYYNITEGADLPVMAQVHALDAEARIGDRPNMEAISVEKLLIKEKLNQTEKIAYFLNDLGGRESEVVDYIYNDAANLVSRVITRTEVASMELLSTGKVTINENNVKKTVDFGFKDENRVALAGLSTPAFDFLGALQKIVDKAAAKGWTIQRAYTSTKVMNYLLANEGIKAFFANSTQLVTRNTIASWLDAQFGIEFVTNDLVYKESALGTATHRFFDEDTITFVGTRGTLGSGLFGYTPEELKLANTSERNLVTVTMWDTPDPVATWTKASGVYLPVPRNINGMIIAKVS